MWSIRARLHIRIRLLKQIYSPVIDSFSYCHDRQCFLTGTNLSFPFLVRKSCHLHWHWWVFHFPLKASPGQCMEGVMRCSLQPLTHEIVKRGFRYSQYLLTLVFFYFCRVTLIPKLFDNISCLSLILNPAQMMTWGFFFSKKETFLICVWFNVNKVEKGVVPRGLCSRRPLTICAFSLATFSHFWSVWAWKPSYASKNGAASVTYREIRCMFSRASVYSHREQEPQ